MAYARDHLHAIGKLDNLVVSRVRMKAFHIHNINPCDRKWQYITAAALATEAEEGALAHVWEVKATALWNVALAAHVVLNAISNFFQKCLAPVACGTGLAEEAVAATKRIPARGARQTGLKFVWLIFQFYDSPIFGPSTSFGLSTFLRWAWFIIKKKIIKQLIFCCEMQAFIAMVTRCAKFLFLLSFITLLRNNKDKGFLRSSLSAVEKRSLFTLVTSREPSTEYA